jgi:hypothetical protein
MVFGILENQNLQLTAYSDVDWANYLDEKKSTSGGSFLLGDSLLAWISKKKECISLSTTEVEYIVVATCFTQILWMM